MIGHPDRPTKTRTLAMAALGAIAAIVVVQMPVLAHAELPSGASVAGDYIVHLRDEPVALYNGGIAGYSSTKVTAGTRLDASSTAATSYSAYLVRSQDRLASKVGATITSHYSVTFDGFTATLTAEQAAALAADHGVTSLESVGNSRRETEDLGELPAADSPDPPGDDRASDDHSKSAVSSDDSADEASPIEYPGISSGVGDSSGLGGAWEQVGGPQHAGEGVVIGVIDTGISLQSNFFEGEPLQSSIDANPRWSTGPVSAGDEGFPTQFQKADGQYFNGSCETGPGFAKTDCTSKIIGARFFPPVGLNYPYANDEKLSPRARSGHGPLVASIAAGSLQTDGNDEDVWAAPSGVAPAAKLAIYKVCWTVVRDRKEYEKCPTASILAAIEKAVADGVDVINLSLGGTTDSARESARSRALFGANQAGVYVVSAAGNSGPDASTIAAGNAAPWMTSVANNTATDLRAKVTIIDPSDDPDGASVENEISGLAISPERSIKAPLILGSAAAKAGVKPEAAASCADDSLDPEKATGAIVVCRVHVTGNRPGTRSERLKMADEVSDVGGIAVLLVADGLTATRPIDTATSIPTVFFADDDYGKYLIEAAGRASADGTEPVWAQLKGGASTSPVIESSSSRGPLTEGTADLLSPDISAIGTSMKGAGANRSDVSDDDDDDNTGTSFSAPVVSGLAAIYLSRFPTARSDEIKSALMTTAHSLRVAKYVDSSDVFAQGAGTVSGASFLDPGLLYIFNDAEFSQMAASAESKVASPIMDPSDLNVPSIQIGALNGSQTITRRLTSLSAGTWTPTITEITGMTAAVSPSTLTFDGPGVTKNYTVTYTRTDAPVGVFVTGYLSWVNTVTAQTVRIPFAIRPANGVERTISEIVAASATGSVTVNVRSSISGTITPQATSLAEGVAQTMPTGAAVVVQPGAPASTKFDYPDFTVANDGGFARFAVSGASTAPESSVKLSLFRATVHGAVEVATTDFEGPTGNLDVFGLTAGRYLLRIVAPATPNPPRWSLTQYLGSANGGDAPRLEFEPTILNFDRNVEQTVRVKWAGLAAGSSYVGYVGFGDSSWRTSVLVTVPELELAPVPLSITNVKTLIGPLEGPTVGKSHVSITGTGFDAQTTITFDGVEATVSSISTTEIVVESPPHAAGPVAIVATRGSRSVAADSAFTYREPPSITAISPPTVLGESGGEITIVGSGFQSDTKLFINGDLVIARIVTSSNKIVATSPPGPAGVVSVRVSTEFGSADGGTLLTYQ